MQLPLSAFLMIMDLSRLTRCSARCSFSDRLLFRGLTCGQSSVIAVMYSSSLGLLALRRLTKEFKSSRRLDMSGALGVGA